MALGRGDGQLAAERERTRLLHRTKAFALSVLAFIPTLPRNLTSEVTGRQLIRSATSVGVNYRATRRAKSTPDFIAKMAIVEEEADESSYWLELLVEGGFVPQERVDHLLSEADQIVAMTVSSVNTARQRQRG